MAGGINIHLMSKNIYVIISEEKKLMEEIILKNGLKIIKELHNTVHIVNLSLFFRIGSLYEPKHLKGITHVVEHMFFRKLNLLSQRDLYYKTESIGTTLRGCTSRDYVKFDMNISKKYFKEALDILVELLKPFQWQEKEYLKEREVVKRQIEVKMLSFYEKIDNMYFNNDEYAYPIMGELKDINNISLLDINYWKNKWFTCNNACLVVSGCFSNDELINSFNEFELIKNTGEINKRIFLQPEFFKKRTLDSDNLLETDDDFTDIWITFDISGISTEESYAANFLSNMLGRGDGSLLSLKIREKLHLTDEIFCTFNSFFDTSRILIECTCSQKKIFQILEEIFLCIDTFKTKIGKREYLSTIPFFTTNADFIYDNPRELSHSYGLMNFISDEKKWSVEREANTYQQLRIKDLHKYANEIFISKNMTINLYYNKQIIQEKKLIKKIKELRSKMN